MSERCPGCRRPVGPGEARCARCGTGLLGVELEGDGAFGGDDVVLGGRAARAPSDDVAARRRTMIAAGGAVGALVIGLAVFAPGGTPPRVAGTTTTATAGATTTGPLTPTALERAPTSSSALAGVATVPVVVAGAGSSPTTIDVRQVTSAANDWTATIVRRPGLGTLVVDTASGGRAERTGLTMFTTAAGSEPAAVFTDLDTGDTVSVSISVSSAADGNVLAGPQPFRGGAVMQLAVDGHRRTVALLVYPDGRILAPENLGAMVAIVGSPANSGLARAAWFVDSADAHRLRLVDLPTGTVQRTTTIPALTTAVDVTGDDPVVLDPAGHRYAVAPDGALRPSPLPEVPLPVAGERQVTLDCDPALVTCTQTYVDESGARTPLLDSSRALTASPLPAPAGAPLVAFVPVVACPNGCPFGDPVEQPGGRIEVVDPVRGGVVFDAPTSAAVIDHPFGTSVGAPLPATWSTDGRWLFYPVPDRVDQLGAWRPGLATPLSLVVGSETTTYSSFASTRTFFPTPA